MARVRRLFGPIAFAAVAFCVGSAAPAVAQRRDTVLATGSATVAPFTRLVGDALAEGNVATVEVRSIGTLNGYAEFCRGQGLRYPDIQDASRRMNAAEFSNCVSRGVSEIMEIPIGYDGIVVAHRRGLPAANFTLAQIWMGLAKEVPQNGRLVPNPYTRWREIAATLPDWPIHVIGPSEGSGTRDSFIEMAMLVGCQAVPEVRAISDTVRRRAVCATLREDGGWTDAGEDYDRVVRLLVEGEPGLLGIFGYGFLATNARWIEAVRVEGVADTPEDIASGRYPLARGLFLYVKRRNIDVVPGLRAVLTEYVSDRAMGPEGYLVRRGLVPLEPGRLERVRRGVADQVIMMRRPEN